MKNFIVFGLRSNPLGFNGLVPTMPSTLISQQENLVHAAVLGDNYPSKWKKAMESIRGTCISANALLCSFSFKLC